MLARRITCLALALHFASPFDACAASSPHVEPARDEVTSERGSVRFVENLGQWPADVRFAAHVGGGVARAECGGLGFHAIDPAGRGAYVRLVFEGGARSLEPRGVDPLPGVQHYYLGNDPSGWRTNARAFAAVRYDEVYPGVHLLLRGQGGNAKYDLEFNAGVDPGVVRARWVGQEAAALTEGALALHLGSAAVHELPIVAWQAREDGTRRSVRAHWRMDATGGLRLEVDALDATLPLVVDPEIVWGTYIAGPFQPGNTADRTEIVRGTHDDGVIAVGLTSNLAFPTTPGAFFQALPGAMLVTVTRLRGSDGSAVYSALLGGAGGQWQEFGLTYVDGLAVDTTGRALVVGSALAPDFPTTPGAYDQVKDTYRPAFAFRLSPDGGQLEYSTFLEGTLPVQGAGASAGYAFEDGTAIVVGGVSHGPYFPTTWPNLGTFPPPGTQDPAFGAGFVLKLNASGSALVWSRLIGSNCGVWDLAITQDGHLDLIGTVRGATFPTTPGSFMPVKPHPTNQILFAMQLSGDGADLRWSTFLGSADPHEGSFPGPLSLDRHDNLTFSFTTRSTTFPTTSDSLLPTPGSDASYYGGGITRLAADGSRLIASTYTTAGLQGGLGAPSTDASGVVTAISDINSQFQATPGAADTTLGPGHELQVGRLDPRLRRILHLSYFGGPVPKGPAESTFLHTDGTLTVAGMVQGPGGMPTTPGSWQPNWSGAQDGGFVFRLHLSVAGVTPIGAGTPACVGAIATEAWRNPVSGASDFGLYCSGAPEKTLGALLVGRPAATLSFLHGAAIHVDRFAGLRVLRVRTDEFGYVETPLPVPALPPGTTFAAQYVFRNTEGCPGPGRLSSSNAVLLTLQ
jgi:hypothetical protein